MAHVAIGWELVVTLVDQGGNQTRRRFSINGGPLGVDVATNADTIITRLMAVTNASLKSYSVNWLYAEDAFGLPGDAEIEEEALIVVQLTTDPTKTANLTIPAPKATLFQGSTGLPWNTIDPTDTAVSQYIDMFKVGGIAFISDGETTEDMPAGYISGKRIHRGSRKG